MSSRTAPALSAPVTPAAVALDADGEGFSLDFGFGAMPAGKVHTDRKAADPVEAALATETVANHFRAEALKLG